MSTCLDLSWCPGFDSKWIADWLSWNTIFFRIVIPKLGRSYLSHSSSQVTPTDECGTIGCLLDFQDTRGWPRKTEPYGRSPCVWAIAPISIKQMPWGWILTELEIEVVGLEHYSSGEGHDGQPVSGRSLGSWSKHKLTNFLDHACDVNFEVIKYIKRPINLL